MTQPRIGCEPYLSIGYKPPKSCRDDIIPYSMGIWKYAATYGAWTWGWHSYPQGSRPALVYATLTGFYVIRNRLNQHCYGKERVLEVRRSDASGNPFCDCYRTGNQLCQKLSISGKAERRLGCLQKLLNVASTPQRGSNSHCWRSSSTRMVRGEITSHRSNIR